MSQYMVGLQLSGYIWKSHLTMHRWFRNKLKSFAGTNYLEIGPGHGQYFLEAVNMQGFEHYYRIDLSESSLNLTLDWCRRFRKEGIDNYEMILDNFPEHTFEQKFDAVCMSEVLEHLEKPMDHLKKIFEITNDGADVYILVPINAPAIDHIYLFHNVEEVFDMVKDAGFTIKDHICSTGNDISYEKAVKKKSAVNLALHLVK